MDVSEWNVKTVVELNYGYMQSNAYNLFLWNRYLDMEDVYVQIQIEYKFLEYKFKGIYKEYLDVSSIFLFKRSLFDPFLYSVLVLQSAK